MGVYWIGIGVNFSGNFKLIGQCDIEPVKALIHALNPEHWAAEQYRQKRYNVHKDTESISLVYDIDFRHVKPTQHPALNYFGDAIRPILSQVAAFYDNTEIGQRMEKQYGQGYCIRANLVRLNPAGVIDKHQDKNFSLAHSHRIHIPIITNDEVHFTVGEQTQSLPEGAIIEINNRREHSVENRSQHARIHLILDWVITNEPCCCAEKTHPAQPCTPSNCEATDRLHIPCECHPIIDISDLA